ncbi:MAG: DUF2339 domain-containing protein [Phyllobacteriaceae bacterium]|nr:DUF2339 domain-containing protein [Phyllobacteriaceae bacterium]
MPVESQVKRCVRAFSSFSRHGIVRARGSGQKQRWSVPSRAVSRCGMTFLLSLLALLLAVVAFNRVSRLESRMLKFETRFDKLAEAIQDLREGRGPEHGPWSEAADPSEARDAPSVPEPAKTEGAEGGSDASPDDQDDGDNEDVDSGEDIAAAAFDGASISQQTAKRRSWKDFERTVGAHWSVILGGIAVALGTVFLVKYSIEAGLLGPAQRITLGFAVSFALLGLGEWMRRRDLQFSIPAVPAADVPGVLTAAGIEGAFAYLYAGHTHGFFGPALTSEAPLIGLASLALSAVHGPKLAALGVIGAYLVPVLVTSRTPSPMALAGHVLIVTGSVLAVARLRQWLWLAFCGIAGATVWTCLATGISLPINGIAGMLLVLGSAVLFTAAFGWQIAERPDPPEDRGIDVTALVAFAALTIAFAVQLGNEHLPEALTGSALALAMMAVAGFWPGFAPIALFSALAVLLTAAVSDLPLLDIFAHRDISGLPEALRPPDINGYLFNLAMIGAPMLVAGLFCSNRTAVTAPKWTGWLASAVGSAVFGILIISYLRIAPFETRPLFGALALAAAFCFGWLTERFGRSRPGDMKAPAPAAFAVTAIALIAFAIGVALSKAWMPFGFTLTAAGIAYVYSKRPVFVLPWLVVGAAAFGGLALWFSVPFPGAEIGTVPFLNKLVILVGLPTMALLGAGELLRRQESEPFASIVTSIGLAALALFIALELRHWINDGEIAGGSFTLADMAVQSIAALGFSIGLQIVAKRSGAGIFDTASLVAGAASVAVCGLGLLLAFNPFFTGENVGERSLINLLLPGYLIPAVLAGIVAYMARPIRPRVYTLGYALLAGLLLFTFVTATTRHGFQGGNLGLWQFTGDLEFWTYSAVWLVLGAAVLALGLWLQSIPVRLAAAALIGLTIIKVFLLDMSALTGVLRALSFLGLGAFLIVVGRYYQRILRGLATSEDGEEGGGVTAPEGDAD